MALQGFKALVKAESSQVSFTDEATTTSDSINYQITDSSKRIWGFNSTIIVEDSTVPTTEKFTINRLNGTVTFETATSRTITVTGDFVFLTTVAEAKEWSFDGTSDLIDSTVFEKTEREFTPALLAATATIGKFYTIDNFFFSMLFDGTTKVIELFADSAGNPFIIFANVASDSLSIPIEALIEESINLQITDRMIIET